MSFGAVAMEFVATSNPVFFGGKLLNGFAIGTIVTIMISYIGEVGDPATVIASMSSNTR